MTAGLDGTPMPSFADSMSEAERWAISYYVLSFSAFNDPLTGEKLKLDGAIRARLNDAGGEAYESSRLALDPSAPAETTPKALVRFHKGLMGEGR
jgi:cytochrome c oxidase cbb3-type subunit 2